MLVVKIILDCKGFYTLFIEEEYYTSLNCHKINPTSRIRQKHVHDENDLSSYNRKFNLPTSCSEKSKGIKSFYFILFYYILLYLIKFLGHTCYLLVLGTGCGLNTYQIMYGETLDFQCWNQQW